MTAATIAPSITFFRDFAAQTRRERVMALPELAELIRTTSAPSKERLPWLKLARFGNGRTKEGSLRSNANLIAISGIEADYDGKEIGVDRAVETAEKAGLLALIYTSPRHTPVEPRWRVLCPTSREYPPKERARLLGRLNGLYHGIFARESWTLSQSYYFGRVSHAPAHRVELAEGEPIDLLDELDAIALGPPAGSTGTARPGAEIGAGGEARGDAELIRRIVAGAGFHPELCALAARYLGRGLDSRAVAEILRGLMLAHPDTARDARWHDRYRSIGSLVASAATKFAPEAERRRAIARLTHRMARQRRTGEEIKAAILAEAERCGLPSPCALAIGNGILRDLAGSNRHA